MSLFLLLLSAPSLPLQRWFFHSQANSICISHPLASWLLLNLVSYFISPLSYILFQDLGISWLSSASLDYSSSVSLPAVLLCCTFIDYMYLHLPTGIMSPEIHHDAVEGCEDIGKPGYVEPEKIHLKIIMGPLYRECKTGYIYYETTNLSRNRHTLQTQR